jgi:hypothetical protein
MLSFKVRDVLQGYRRKGYLVFLKTKPEFSE